jgi:putative membrane protein insertion efficiency factor
LEVDGKECPVSRCAAERDVGKPGIFALAFLAVICIWGFAACAYGWEAKMKGPKARSAHSLTSDESETSSVQIACLQSIRFYQKWISPIRGVQCGFRPSCSAYGSAALEQQGPIVGIMMTADRLMRCNMWKGPGPDYTLLPNGKLYDPPSKNLLSEK